MDNKYKETQILSVFCCCVGEVVGSFAYLFPGAHCLITRPCVYLCQNYRKTKSLFTLSNFLETPNISVHIDLRESVRFRLQTSLRQLMIIFIIWSM